MNELFLSGTILTLLRRPRRATPRTSSASCGIRTATVNSR